MFFPRWVIFENGQPIGEYDIYREFMAAWNEYLGNPRRWNYTFRKFNNWSEYSKVIK
jgi:hypothetical protein